MQEDLSPFLLGRAQTKLAKLLLAKALLLKRAHTNLAKSKNAFEHVLALLGESILLVALGKTIAFCEATMLCLKANLLRAKALLPKVNLLLANALLHKAALLDWSAPGLT